MGKTIDRVVNFQKLWGLGSTQVDFVKSFIHLETALAVLTFLKVWYPAFDNIALIAATGIGYSFLKIGFAKWLDKYHKMPTSQQGWDMERNPAIQLIIRKLNSIESRLTALEAKTNGKVRA